MSDHKGNNHKGNDHKGNNHKGNNHKGKKRDGRNAIAHRLSQLLRHTAVDEGLSMRADGYVSVGELVAHLAQNGATSSIVQDIVRQDAKGRFELATLDDDRLYIRATQGHSIRSVDSHALLTPATEDVLRALCPHYPWAYHGTYRACIPGIVERGLLPCKRNHVHLSPKLPEDLPVSGMRFDCEVVLSIDVARVMQQHRLPLFVSSNEVILSEHAIPPDCVQVTVQT